MAEISRVVKYTIDIDAPVIPGKMSGVLVEGDHKADVLEIELKRGGVSLAASTVVNSANALVTNQDGQTIRNTGTVTDDISIPLSQESYAVPGYVTIEVQVTYGSVSRTILIISARVEPNGRGILIDPTASIPTTEELLAIVKELREQAGIASEAAEDATTAAQSATSAASGANTAKTAANNAAANANSAASAAEAAAQSAIEAAATADNVAALIVRRNMLDNWYFVNPVNQRGQTTYSGVGYHIDRWLFSNSRGTLRVESDSVELTTNGAGTAFFRQTLETPLNDGETYTLSILVKANAAENYIGTMPDPTTEKNNVTYFHAAFSWELFSLTFTATQADPVGQVAVRCAANCTMNIKAMKLERGANQTLAHWDADNAVWVLNESPDYGQQLAQCQRFYQRYDTMVTSGYTSSSATKYYMSMFLPVPMRTTPAVQLNNYTVRTPTGLSAHAGSSGVAPTSLDVTMHSNHLYLTDTIAQGVDANNVSTAVTLRGLVLNADL